MTQQRLLWGISGQFRTYLAQVDDAEIICSDGASEQSDGRFAFPSAVAMEAHGRELSTHSEHFHGTVEFLGYGGLLHVKISRIVVSYLPGGRGVLCVEPPGYRPPADAVMQLAELSVDLSSSGSKRLFDVRLLLSGTLLFDNRYRPGFLLDDLEIRI